MRLITFKTALALGVGLTALSGWTVSVHAQDAPAPAIPPTPAGPGPATQPPAAPGTEVPAPTQPAAPDSGAAPPNYNVQYNGLIDGYYLFNFRNPKDSSGGGHYYDVHHNSPSLSLAEVNVFKNAKPSGFGFKATLTMGDTADINHFASAGSSTGEARFKALTQLYGTYALGGDGAGLDFGKFYTPFGYEVVEANGNYNYSRSLPFGLVPTYHTGARIYTPIPGVAGLTATFYLVNAIFNTATAGVQDDNKKPGYAGQLNYTDPKGKFVLISELALGKDKFDGSGGPDAKITLNDNNFTYNFSATTLAGLDYVYREIKRDNSPKQKTNGYAVYFRQALTPKTAAALRFSGYNDKTDGSDSFKPYEITATYELKPAANFTTRLEFRHDHSNVATFIDKDSNPTKKDQNALEIAGIFTF